MDMRSEHRNGPSREGLIAGALASLPVMPAIVPFGMIFGIAATAAGLDLIEAMAMTTIVVAGASQLASLQLMVEGAPALVAILTGAVVNLRMAMYSASIAVHWEGVSLRWRVLAAFVLHDQAYGLSIKRYRERAEGPAMRVGFFLGLGSATIVVWVAASLAGALLGPTLLPPETIRFMVPVTFMAIAAPMLMKPADLGAASTAMLLAYLLLDLPYGLGLVVAAAGGIAVGMGMEGRR